LKTSMSGVHHTFQQYSSLSTIRSSSSSSSSSSSKAIPVTGRGGPYGCETSRLPRMAMRSALRAGRSLLPGRFLVLTSARDWVDRRAIVRLERLGQLKNPMTSSGIEPATFRLVA
jgi:hypothetical protein